MLLECFFPVTTYISGAFDIQRTMHRDIFL